MTLHINNRSATEDIRKTFSKKRCDFRGIIRCLNFKGFHKAKLYKDKSLVAFEHSPIEEIVVLRQKK